jgi:hypothetical protein
VTKISRPAECGIDGQPFRHQNQEIERKQQEWLKQKGVFGASGG